MCAGAHARAASFVARVAQRSSSRVIVHLPILLTSALSSLMVMREAGLRAKILLSSSLHCLEMGRMERKKSGFER